ncbi:glycosyltransferase [Deinococcus petrolearius]|uniref:Glycosyltransferase n=1 Tax=Deinococcus petrolearius TaxID=1751295 RepID=A0ABW1DG96_9DEIO
MKIVYDNRWSGAHGIGRFSSEIRSRLAGDIVDITAKDPISLRGLLALEIQSIFKKIEGEYIFFSPGYTPPVFWNSDLIFTIHDLIHLEVEEEKSNFKSFYYQKVVLPATRRAKKVVTVSEFSKKQIIKWSKIPPEKIEVVYNGVSKEYNPQVKPYLPGYPYILYVGNRKPHKNIPRLISAFVEISKIYPELRLILSGEPDLDTKHLLLYHGIYERVIFSGYIEEKHLPSLYKGAKALVLVSLYEGFGLPVIEAMACGTPVVTSCTTSLPEVAGDAAIFVDPLSVESIVNGLRHVLSDEVKQGEIISKGFENIKRFDWHNTSNNIQNIILNSSNKRDLNYNTPVKIFVQLAYGQDSIKWEEKFKSGKVPDKVPYGYHYAESESAKLKFSHDKPEPKILKLFRKALTRLLGTDLIHIWRHKAEYIWADIIWTHTERENLAALLLISSLPKNQKPKIISQSVWLMDRWDKLPLFKRIIYRKLLGKSDILTFHSNLNAKKAHLEKLNTTIQVVPFGISSESFPVTEIKSKDLENRPLKLLALGNDIHRDWLTLINAVKDLDQVTLKILTSKNINLDKVDNVEIINTAGQKEVLEYYAWADAIAIPLKENMHASGLTVMLEASAIGKPVLITYAGGLDEYFTDKEVTFIRIGNIEEWQKSIIRLRRNYTDFIKKAELAQKVLIEKKFTSYDYAMRHIEITNQILKITNKEGNS